jgi:hypothetical protein
MEVYSLRSTKKRTTNFKAKEDIAYGIHTGR